MLFGHTDAVTSTCVMAIKLTNENGQRMVGVAYAEPSLRKLGVLEFLENDQFSNIEVGGASLHHYDVQAGGLASLASCLYLCLSACIT